MLCLGVEASALSGCRFLDAEATNEATEEDAEKELTEDEKMYLYNLMLKSHVSELVEQIEAHEEESELLVEEVR